MKCSEELIMECPEELMTSPIISIVKKFPRGLDFYSDEIREVIVDYYDGVNDYYYQTLGYKMIGSISEGIPGEMLRNAYAHGGGAEFGVDFAYFLNNEWIVVGCNDHGPYFNNSDIKRLWESGGEIKTEGKKYDSNGRFISGCNSGVETIFDLSSKRLIKNNTLFVQSSLDFLASEFRYFVKSSLD